MSVGCSRVRSAYRLIICGFALCFAIITLRLGQLSLWPPGVEEQQGELAEVEKLPRPDIVDRNGVVLATDISIPSLYADPQKDPRYRRDHRAADGSDARSRGRGPPAEAFAETGLRMDQTADHAAAEGDRA